MVVLLCPSLLTLLASILLSWVVQLVFWLCQEHLELFLLIWQEKRVVRKNLTCLDKTLTLQDLNTWEVRRRTFQHRNTSDRKGLFMYELYCNEVCLNSFFFPYLFGFFSALVNPPWPQPHTCFSNDNRARAQHSKYFLFLQQCLLLWWATIVLLLFEG